ASVGVASVGVASVGVASVAVASVAASVIDRLRDTLGAKVLTDPAETEPFSHDRSHHPWQLADVVVRCTSTRDVAEVLRICSDTNTPVVPFGTGTGLEGGANLSRGCVCLDVSGMNRIVRLDPDSLDVTVEAGVKRSELNPVLAGHGLFFPVGPGVDASIGGMAATGASGTNAVYYGTMRESVLGLTVVLADGTVLNTGGRARKSAAGYDLTHLFVGSEGTLGVITEITLRVYGIPPSTVLMVSTFGDLAAAARVVQRALGGGIQLARAELLDDIMVGAIDDFSGLALDRAPTLLLEFIGGPASVAEDAERVRAFAADEGSLSFTLVDSAPERERIWQARHDALPAAAALKDGAQTWSTDVCVPISRLADCIGQTKADLDASSVLAPIAGHVGDGNFHLAFVLHPDDAAGFAEAQRINGRLVERAVTMGGTCTGEHGIGIGKTDDLLREHPTGVPLMRILKGALDPLGIMNPGKVLQ
ncbi:MAG: FAD-linked oxidase C-terminal domain-containing protein, partial [Leifsonia sp.]